jgi:hypothetical protein
MDRLDRRLQPSHFAQLTASTRTSASFHAAARAEPRVPCAPAFTESGPELNMTAAMAGYRVRLMREC